MDNLVCPQLSHQVDCSDQVLLPSLQADFSEVVKPLLLEAYSEADKLLLLEVFSEAAQALLPALEEAYLEVLLQPQEACLEVAQLNLRLREDFSVVSHNRLQEDCSDLSSKHSDSSRKPLVDYLEVLPLSLQEGSSSPLNLQTDKQEVYLDNKPRQDQQASTKTVANRLSTTQEVDLAYQNRAPPTPCTTSQ